MGSDTTTKLKLAIEEYDKESAETLAKQAMSEGLNPIEVINDLISVISRIGDDFGKGELFLPDLIGAADALQGAMPVLEEEIAKKGLKREKVGSVVIGTVFGDIHNIGKDMVGTLLMAEGFDVHDLGINVTADTFIGAVKEQNPDILAMSSLLTTTAYEQEKVIKELDKSGLRSHIKVIVGGGAITDDFAQKIGADGYEPTAVEAVKLAKRLLKEG
ncbi:MAG: corrinoid protein [Spirochaetes bacterium]|nr:corrinoid protein [Spirochaetota bacterium]